MVKITAPASVLCALCAAAIAQTPVPPSACAGLNKMELPEFAIALPQNWKQRFLLQGGGDLSGSVHFPLGASAAGGDPGLARGFAVASTDTGHQGRGGSDASFNKQTSISHMLPLQDARQEAARRC